MLSPSSAQPVRPNGYPVTNVNLRGGPGTYYPALLVVPARSPISILGCLGDYSWCDVLFQGNRGWMRSIYLQGWYQGQYYSLGDYAPRLGYRVVSFNIGPYWDANYRDRPFYRDRGKWGGAGGSYGEGWADRSSFYGRLAPYGDWIWLEGQYVWVPEGVGPQWRPYTIGRWAYTDRYGWMWVSREPFGWATYHYGRWGFSRRVGWFWVPGSRWAPAWVSWRQSDDYLAWAPLPPTADEGLGININIRVGTIPDYYWQVVPDRDFLSDDLPGRIVRDRNRFDPILRETRPLGNVTVVNNNVVVNNVVNVTRIEQKTRKKVVVHQVERTKDEKKTKGGANKVDGAAIEVFQPAPEETPKSVAPPKPKPIEEVAAQSETKEQAQGATTTEEMLVPQEVQKAPEAEAKTSTPPRHLRLKLACRQPRKRLQPRRHPVHLPRRPCRFRQRKQLRPRRRQRRRRHPPRTFRQRRRRQHRRLQPMRHLRLQWMRHRRRRPQRKFHLLRPWKRQLRPRRLLLLPRKRRRR